MNDELKEYLKNYLGDLRYWRGLDIDSINQYTSGTPHVRSEQQLATYTRRLEDLLKEKQEDE